MSTHRTVAFHTLGCKLNFSETSTIGKLFEQAGYQEVNFNTPSDLYIINTCSVTDEADRKCRKAVRAAVRQNAEAQIIVIGCYAQLKPEEISAIPGVSMVLGATEKFRILDYIHRNDLASPHTGIYQHSIEEVTQFVPGHSIDDRTRSFLKVQDGCDYKCSFCTIPLARGRSRSGEIPPIVKAASELIAHGIKEIVLTGVNIGDFGNGTEVLEGIKPKKQALFIDLVQALDELEGDIRFRISSIEPNLCTYELIDFVAGSKHFMPHFHMPLQSGDNEILSLMKRRYKRELYEDRVNYIKSKMPHACIGVDLICGFPGETERHFDNTYRFIEKLDISYLHVFTYSERPNTAALEQMGKVSPEVRHLRSKKLRNLSDQKKLNYYLKFEQSEQELLVENKLDNGYISGYSKNYLRIHLNKELAQVNQLVTVKLGSIKNEPRRELSFYAELV